MSMAMPKFMSSKWYDPETDKLREGAPKELVDEYNEYHEPSDEVLDEELIRPKRTKLTEDDFT
jgi:hypothetical protein